MIFKQFAELGRQEAQKHSFTPKDMSIRSACYFLVFLGFALLLSAHLELWIIPLAIVLATFFPMHDSKETGITNLAVVALLYLILVIILISLYYFFLLPFLRPPISETTKNIALIYFALIMILLGVGASMKKDMKMQFYYTAFLYINLMLWKLKIVHRQELVWLFAAESIVFLIAAIYSLHLYITKERNEEILFYKDGYSAQTDISAAVKEADSELEDIAARGLEKICNTVDKVSHTLDILGIHSTKLEQASRKIQKAEKLLPVTFALIAHLKEKYGIDHPILNSQLYEDEAEQADNSDAFPAWKINFELPKDMMERQAEFESEIRSFLETNHPKAFVSLREFNFK